MKQLIQDIKSEPLALVAALCPFVILIGGQWL